MLWAKTYKKASLGRINSFFLRHINFIFISTIVTCGILEVVLRVLWRITSEGSRGYMIVIGLYYLLLLLILIIINVSFLSFGLRLYNNLIQFEDVNINVKLKLQRITVLTVGSTLCCLICLAWVLGTFSVEMSRYHFVNMISFLVEQMGFRALELGLSCLILYFLRAETQTMDTNPSNPNQPLIQSRQRLKVPM